MKITVGDVEIDVGETNASLISKMKTLSKSTQEDIINTLTDKQDSLKHYFKNTGDTIALRCIEEDQYQLLAAKVLASFSPKDFETLVFNDHSDDLVEFIPWIYFLRSLNVFIAENDILAIRNLRGESLITSYKPQIIKTIFEQKLKTAGLSKNQKSALSRLNTYINGQVPSLREMCIDTIEREGLFAHKACETKYDLERLPEELQSNLSKNKPS